MRRRDILKSAILAAGSITLGDMRSLVVNMNDHIVSARVNEPDYWSMIRQQFKFEENILYLNNASLGASPLSVRDATHVFHDLLDEYPSKYMWGGWKDEKEAVRESAATLLNASTDEIALTHNTTEGMNLIASSLDLEEGDEVIIGNHEHPTARIPWKYYQEEGRGVKLVRPELPLIPTTKEEIVSVYRDAITSRTKVISMVHITNTNGMMLPVKEISEMARSRGILTAVDGAQAVGAIRVDVREIGCDYYASSCHKGLFSPKGMGLLYARTDASPIKPLIANRRYKASSMRRVEDYNTRNLPELLGLGVALDFHNTIGTEAIEKRLKSLKHYFLKQVEGLEEFTCHTPPSDDLSCHIVAVEKDGMTANQLKNCLKNNYNIDTRWMGSHGMNGIRVSFSVFTIEEDIDRLVSALQEARIEDQ